MEEKDAAIIDSPFLNVFIIALKAWNEDPAEAWVWRVEKQEMMTFADANEAHRWAQAHLTVGKWAILKVKLHLTR